MTEKKEQFAIAVFSILFILLLSNSTSPLFRWYEISIDPAWYEVIGRNWLEGRLPYRDLFDHKGPLLFAINALGYIITGNRYGIMLIQIPCIFFSITYSLLMLRIEYNRKQAVCLSAIVFICLLPAYCDGDNDEEYALPFLFASYYYGYLFLKRYSSTGCTDFNVYIPFIFGISLGVCFMTVITNATGVCAFAVGIAIILIKQKEWNNLAKAIALFICGVAVVAVPFFIYFAVKNALSDFWYGFWTFSVKYAKNFKGGLTISLNSLLVYSWPWLLVATTLASCATNKKNRIIRIPFLLAGIASAVYFVFTAGPLHYPMTTIPYIAIILNIIKFDSSTNAKALVKAQHGILALVFILNAYCGAKVAYSSLLANSLITSEQKRLSVKPFIRQLYDMLSIIPPNEQNEILEVNCPPTLYMFCDARPPYRNFSDQTFHSLFDPNMRRNILNDFRHGSAKWIIINSYPSDRELLGIIQERYTLIKKHKNLSLYKIRK